MSLPVEELIRRADEAGVRLELVGGLPIWEAHPAFRHQREVDRVRASIRPSEAAACSCLHVSDVLVRFPDGSFKRPDIAVFCREPEEAELDEALTLVPEAVIEVVSPGYESKDFEIGPRFYLSQGVRDVLVLDPRSLVVLHHRLDGLSRLTSPAPVELECGCSCVV